MASQRVDATTIAKQIKKEEINIFKNNVLLALIEDKARMTFNCSGKKMEWNAKVKRTRLNTYEDGDPQNFDRINRRIELSLPWRSYRAGEAVGEIERAMTKGEEARVHFLAQTSKDLMDDVKYDFAPKLLLDGEDPDNLGEIHGIESFLAYTGTGPYFTPDDTYAGKSTVYGVAAGGELISGTYPTGSFDVEYDAWSPLIVNALHAQWLAEAGGAGNENKAWALAVRAGLIHNVNTRGMAQGKVDVLLTTAEKYRVFLSVLDDKERILIDRGASTSRLIKLGFGNVTNYDGTDITYEANVPAGKTYGFKYDQMELMSLHGQLFMPSEDFDHERLSDRYSVLFLGNLRFNPRGFLLIQG